METTDAPRRAPKSTLRIAVSGLAATYPFGGVFWDYMQYLLGFHRLGHTVLYIEDIQRWSYDPARETFVDNGSQNARYLAEHIVKLDPALSDRWFFRDAAGQTYGCPWQEVVRFCREADLFLRVSASPLSWLRDEYLASPRIAFLDTDPMYTQAAIQEAMVRPGTETRIKLVQDRHVCLTFAENIGDEVCRVPRQPFVWHPTRQPLVLSVFQHRRKPWNERRKVLTTVASWQPTEAAPVVDGVSYGGKNIEFRRIINLPARSPLPLEVALSGRPPVDELKGHGWHLVDAYSVSSTPDRYLDYLSGSLGEFSVAKQAYVASRSGWFSCRTACYLALGVPAIVQDTGFRHRLPTGQGLFAFNTTDEAAAAIEDLASRPASHAKAAYELAQEYFDSGRVLTKLLETALNRETCYHVAG